MICARSLRVPSRAISSDWRMIVDSDGTTNVEATSPGADEDEVSLRFYWSAGITALESSSPAVLGEAVHFTATVTGTDSLGGVVTDTALATVDAIAPAVAIAKTAAPTVTYAGGQVTYTYAVTNAGDDPLASVVVTDDRCAAVSGRRRSPRSREPRAGSET